MRSIETEAVPAAGISRPAAAVLILALTGLASFRVAQTWRVLSHTVDEPAHLASGMEWLTRGRYTMDVQHPPLARIAIATLPRLGGTVFHDRAVLREEGMAELTQNGRYWETLTRARLGALPFLWIGVAAAALWAGRLAGTWAAVVAAGLLVLMPPVLAHAGFAATDMAAAATVTAACVALLSWIEAPVAARAALFGLAGGLAILSKFTAIAYLLCAGLATAAALAFSRRPVPRLEPRRLLRTLPWAAAVAAIVIWAGYRFSVFFPSSLGGHIPWPAPELVDGLRNAASHVREGHPSYLMGERSSTGWWYFFPVALAVKTPLAFLLLAAAGVVASIRIGWKTRDWRPAIGPATAVGILLGVMRSPINLGVRHVLVVYFLLAPVAAWALLRLVNKGPRMLLRRGAAVVVLVWLLADSVSAHPDYVAFFNGLGERDPGWVVNGSDFDWGQEVGRLEAAAQSRGLQEVRVAMRHPTEDPVAMGMTHLQPLPPRCRAEGWVAVPDFHRRGILHDGYVWVDRFRPADRIGRAMWLYRIPKGEASDLPECPTPSDPKATTR